MPLVYLPREEVLFVWGAPEPLLHAAVARGAARAAFLATPEGVRSVDGVGLPLLETASGFVALAAADLSGVSGSVQGWVLASKLAVELVAAERVVPTVRRRAGPDTPLEARWAGAFGSADAAAKLAAIAGAMPLSGHAVPVTLDAVHEVWDPQALVRSFVDAVVDALLREARGAPQLPAAAKSAWDERFRAALSGDQREFAPQGFGERSLLDDLARWSEPALGSRDRLRACFRLEPPGPDSDAFQLTFLLQAPEDPSLLVPAADVWRTEGRTLEALGRAFRDPQESLLAALARAARVFPAIAQALTHSRPESLTLDPAAAWTFLGEGAPALSDAGFGVIVPGELTAAGQRRLRLRMRVGGAQTRSTKVAGAVSGVAGLTMDTLLSVDWEAVLGDEALSAPELALLAAHKSPLVRFRGAWVAVDPRELLEIQTRIAGGPSRVAARDVLQAALSGESQQAGLSVAVTSSGAFAELLERLRTPETTPAITPMGLQATLRPYQTRGATWLACMSGLGLGACLADDMGLGKTIQLLAYLLHRLQIAPEDIKPALLIAPTSVIGNWEREAQRFAPVLKVVPHYGQERTRESEAWTSARAPGTLLITSYGLLRRDAALLAQIEWSVVALDEAQNIKNSASATAQAARALRADTRFALTGTPVENRLAELWSILEFANPGMLGPLATFRREFALPIERYGDAEAATRLRRVVSPFVLRRLKSDPAVIQDLPAKNEMKVVCTLTREQATLYKAVVDEELRRIASSTGIERRGRVLALLTATKQICNHPAHYLSERGPLPERSGKLARITEMLEEAVLAGDKALVFTQFREMGTHLVAHFRATLGVEVLFLHGGTTKALRDSMVQRFQEEPRGPRIFVLSVKAGGTGLNLTAANHVFHFDRWWNPAVEDQATDRAYRIGQKRSVQVHKLLCAGTVEERIDALLEQKRSLSEQVVGGGENWITELGSQQLQELFALSGKSVDGSDDGAAEASAAVARKRRRKPAREVSS